MTLQRQDRVVVSQGNGIATSFPFEFEIPRNEYLYVYLRTLATNHDQLLTAAEYSVTGIGSPDGGEVTYLKDGFPISNEYSLVIMRTVTYTQPLDISNQGGFYPEAIEDQLDFMVMQTQQIAETQSRAVAVRPGLIPPIFNAPMDSNLLYVDVNGDIVESETTPRERTERIDGDAALLLQINATNDRIDHLDAPSKWIVGAVDPTIDDGALDDLYLNKTSGDIFGPKTAGGWGAATGNITGPQGEQGIPGEDGADGAPGVGIATGGVIGQMLVKIGEANYATGWQDQPTITPPFAYTTRAAATAATIPADVTFIRTGGYRTLGDGGDGLYKKVASQPAHLGRIQSADGAWWELIVQTVTAMQFGAYGDGVTNDTTYVKAALDYMRNPSTTGLPGSVPRRNFRRKLDLLGRLYAISETLDIDMCYGLHLDNGALIAIGTWSSPLAVMIWASNAAAANFDNFMITNVVLQCNQKCSGIQLNNASLYQISNVYIYGWGATGNNGSFAFQSLPAGWSSTAMLHNVIALPYTSWLDERPRTDYTGVGFKLGHNDCIITGCEIAAGYKAVQFLTGAAAIQFNDNHTWIANPGNNPGIEINGNFGITMNGNYIDSHPIWVKGAGYRSLNITNNFYLSGSPAPTGFVILESPTANFILDRIVITGNIGSGGTDKVVERYSPSGTGFSATTYNYICKDNAISQTANGNTG